MGSSINQKGKSVKRLYCLVALTAAMWWRSAAAISGSALSFADAIFLLLVFCVALVAAFFLSKF